MTKQEFLAFSLAYDLKISFYDDYRDCNIVEKINGMYVDVYSIMSDTYDGNPDKCKILLRPLSDLTKEIEHNGEKFVPIVELAELANPYRKWRLSSSGLYAVSESGVIVEDAIDFEYDYGYNCFLLDNSAQLDQFKLFRKLIEWKFDLADLISKGEAIDVNTLEINPYK